MIELQVFTESGRLDKIKPITAPDARTAEIRASALLGCFTVHGTVCRVTWIDPATGVTEELEH